MRGARAQLIAGTVALLLLVHALSTPSIAARATLMLGSAAVGISAAVPANPYNTLAQELAEREAALAAREAESGAPSMNERLAPYSLAVSGILFALIALNFVLDWRGRRTFRVSVH